MLGTSENEIDVHLLEKKFGYDVQVTYISKNANIKSKRHQENHRNTFRYTITRRIFSYLLRKRLRFSSSL